MDGRTSALAFLARMLVTATPPVPPLADELPALLAPGLKTSLAVRAHVCARCRGSSCCGDRPVLFRNTRLMHGSQHRRGRSGGLGSRSTMLQILYHKVS